MDEFHNNQNSHFHHKNNKRFIKSISGSGSLKFSTSNDKNKVFDSPCSVRIGSDRINICSENSSQLNNSFEVEVNEEIDNILNMINNSANVHQENIHSKLQSYDELFFQLDISDFSKILPIGEGGYGKVDLVKKKKTGEIFALKTVNINLMVNIIIDNLIHIISYIILYYFI